MMTIRKNLGIKGGFLFAMILALLIAVSLKLWTKSQMSARSKSIIADGQEIVAELNYFTRHWVMAKDKTDFEFFTQSLFAFGKVTEISVWDVKGTQILEKIKPNSGPILTFLPEDRDNIFEKLLKTKKSFFVEHGEKYEIWAPVLSGKLSSDEGDIFVENDEPFEYARGFVRLVRRTPSAPMEQFMTQNILIACLIWLVCSATAYFLAWLFVRPVGEITDKMWAYAAGIDFDPPRDDREDEIGKLAQAFNSMTEKVRRTEKDASGRLELLTELLENSPDATVFASMKGDILLATDRTAELLRYLTIEELVDRSVNIFDHMDRNSRGPFRDFVERALKSPTERPETLSMIRSDQSPVRVEMTISFAYRGDVDPIYFVVSARASELEPSGEPPTPDTMRILDRHISESVSTTLEILASEINTQATNITLNVPLVKDMWNDFMALPMVKTISKETPIAGFSFSETQELAPETFDLILDGGVRIGGILNNLLKISRVADETHDTVNLNGVLQSAVGIVKAFVPEDTATFAITTDEDLPILRGNYRDFEVMTVNLLKTVCHSLTNPKKTVHISTFKDRIEHKDVILIRGGKTGASRNDPQFSEPSETDDLDAEHFGVTALGFAIAKKIARRYGGIIKIDSEPDMDLNLRISFPYKRD